MQALTTIFTAPSWCLTRFAVYIDNNPFHSSTLSPTRGWVDPSFSKCVPSQYTDQLQTLSPGVCPNYMSIARSDYNVNDGRTLWTGGCCQSGFSDMSGYFCTSTVTTPMAFLLLPNITTTDIYTTLSDMWIEHGQITVEWQETDLKDFPTEIMTNYESIMGITLATTDKSSTSTVTTHSVSGRTSSTVATSTSATTASTLTVIPMDTLEPTSGPIETLAITSTHTQSSSVPSSGGFGHPWRILSSFIVCLVCFWTI
ncbi:uncharacterized protein F4817DRAFT_354539 [Daldinia loculata]|uniref:uncharacterized protein n=1 Tax=Daldinia loculata TaxID=103429 RepID=UPI0020C30967|nr:uncharacterized protein F4817DRAFT_354539 [Daldinia loculata]KAI1641891.1 hypothetical protein F4817DRAFT_354539 [Daldinia loculata]